MDYRAIFIGAHGAHQNTRPYDVSGPNDYKAGHLNLGPNGLGFLLSGGYLADAAVYFCPTSTNMPGTFVGGGYAATSQMRSQAAKSLGDVRRAGGTDAHSIMYGDWSWLPDSYTYQPDGNGSIARVLLSHYAYRNLPMDIFPNYVDEPSWNQDYVRMAYTKPYNWQKMVDIVGKPPFKTQKLLGGRALIVDSFAKNLGREATTDPGMGAYGHRDGYNVLYGDWHAKWYGDPQQQFIWWPSHADQWSREGMAHNIMTDYFDQTNSANNSQWKGAVYVWHLLDKDAAIDVGADE